MFRPLVLLALTLVCGSARAQQFTISTIAGGVPPVTPAAAVTTSIGDPPRVAADTAGNIYFASLHSVFKVDPSGTLTRIAGSGRSGMSGDGGPATKAQLIYPQGLAVDSAGNVFVADRDANVIREIKTDGNIVTFAGTGTPAYDGDGGPPAAASFDGPTGLAFDTTGNLYVADTNNSVIRRIAPGGIVTTVAGDGEHGYSGDGGPATAAVLNGPEGVAIDNDGNLYIADTFNHRVRKVGTDGIITAFAANGFPGFGDDNGPALGSTLFLPIDVAVDAAGTVYVADFGNSRIRTVAGGIISTIAGSTSGVQPVDGETATFVRFSGPTGVCVDGAGNLYFAEGSVGSGSGLAGGDFKVWKLSPAGTITTLAGLGVNSFSGDDGPAALAQMDQPAALAFDSHGNLYFADTANNRVRRITPDGQISTVAGFGTAGFAGDGGQADIALLNHPMGVAIDADGTLYIADTGNNRIRKVFPEGVIGTMAGNGNAALFGDGGNALAAALHGPRAVAVDADGTVYIADSENFRVRKVVNGMIDTVPVDPPLKFPTALSLDSSGNLYVADESSALVRKISPAGATTTMAGDDGSLTLPRGVAVGKSGNVYVTDAAQNVIRRIAPDGTAAVIAGTGKCCYAGDGGAANNALLNSPWGIAIGPDGSVYFSDSRNNAIRAMKVGPLPAVAAQ